MNLQLKKNSKKQEIYNDKIDNVLSEISKPPKLELCNPLSKILSIETHDILKTEHVKDLNEKKIEDIKEEYKFEDMKSTVDEGNIPQQLLSFFFFFWWRQRKFYNCLLFAWTY